VNAMFSPNVEQLTGDTFSAYIIWIKHSD